MLGVVCTVHSKELQRVRVVIYMDIANDLLTRIGKKEFAPGQRIPSIRDIAVTYEVSAGTAQNALCYLKNRQFIIKKRGKGFFVNSNSQIDLIAQRHMTNEIISSFLKSMKNIGYTFPEIINIVRVSEHLLKREGIL